MADGPSVGDLLALFKGLPPIHRATLLITVVLVVLLWTAPDIVDPEKRTWLPFQIVVWAWPISVGVGFFWDVIARVSLWRATRKEMAPKLREPPPETDATKLPTIT